MDNPYLKEKLKTIEVKEKKISELLFALKDTAYQGRKLGEVLKIWVDMLQDDKTTILMGLAGSMSTAGMWKIIQWLIENNYIDVLVSTGANISEDIYEAQGSYYYKGSPYVDDSELYEYWIDRFYDVYADEKEYRKMESLIFSFAKNLEERVYSSREFLWKFGEYLYNKGIFSIVTSAYLKKVPVYSPAIIDSGYGVALFNLKLKEKKHIIIDSLLDLEEITKIILNSERTGVIYIGGGVPKDFIQISAIASYLFLENERGKPHYYAIQITTDSPQWGGLSGCTLEEAVSWGKISVDSHKATCYCDATIALPLLVHSINELNIKRKPKLNFEEFFK